MKLSVNIHQGIIKALFGSIIVNSDKFPLADREYSIQHSDPIYVTLSFPFFFMTRKKRLVLRSASGVASVSLKISIPNIPDVIIRSVLSLTVGAVLIFRRPPSVMGVSIYGLLLLYVILDGVSRNVTVDIEEDDRSNFVLEN